MSIADELNDLCNEHVKTIKGVRKILDGVNLFSKTPEKDKAFACDRINEYLESRGY